MAFDLFILDFDGTFTDVEREAAPFTAAYLEQVKSILGEDIESEWARIHQIIQNNPEEHGWLENGQIVAPGNSDPYLRATVTMNILFDERNLYADKVERKALLQNLYFENYPKANTVFRDDAKDVVESFVRSGKPVFVVTNSETEAVKKKLSSLAPEGLDKIEVYGNARKFSIVPSGENENAFDSVPAEMKVQGLARPILTHRGHYYDRLQALWNKVDVTPTKTLVCGDIFELDLALPSALGASVHLVEGDGTADFERRAVDALEGGTRGSLSDALRRALA